VLFAVFQSMLLLIGGLAVLAFIAWQIYRKEKANNHNGEPARSASPGYNGWLGIATGVYLIGFYILLYFHAYYITNWVLMLDPISESLSGYPASQWFVYGFLYCVVMLVMGIRMMIKYRHNRYQLVRTSSVIFFQLGFAFLIPEIMVRLNQPYMDMKNAWPLDYDFFTRDEINKLIGEGSQFAIGTWATSVGTMMFIWGILLVVVVVPLMTYIYGKRWYCSWVCGCGGLAETLGDPYRQLSDKSLRAWRVERYAVHGVLVFAVIMTGVMIYQYVSGNDQLLFLNAYSVKSWYGFMIGSMFSGIVGTGFYPLMGNRVWCRFGCPLAALMGLVQRFKSRFRITTNGGQCISCGNCSTYCEMGIDVRSYAQRGQNIVRASCVGCGICAAVCPRGVLRLENGSADIDDRTTELKALHISKEGVSLMS
ncbi:MAG: 4Fe-4S dicluster domain-containing protein, partial [Bacteroidota bacterium]